MVETLLAKIDHTNLSPVATEIDIDTLCVEALTYQVASVCLSPNYLKTFKIKYPNLKMTTVIGFPNGYNRPEVKAYEAQLAIKDGADELDMVIDLTQLKNQAWQNLEKEIALLRTKTADKVLKVIVETGALVENELKRLCDILIFYNVDYIKTSTGFNFKEDPLEKVRLIHKYIAGRNLKIKVSGGIRTREDALAYEDFEVHRFGASKLLGNLIKMTK